ncbi:GntR family histidine utilization transcriptional repressor [Pseudoduganella flava]|uniref:Histidine utilization repressor n=1 Tax=Pseudoduganella flava TaxID=871742 RepID=A0A562PW79_9BURK|nr:histidine utilization repressor [Pseudoduganella flava]QGZ39793.1 histidine utilization repressor [Pseudoduganella flava]TWI48712.1 GntR family histidine utilization transcriptional repressor [Pseudoduganella flava]
MEAQHDGQAGIPIFQQIKDFLTAQIAAGHWKEGDVIPSEQALVKQFGVSRMTVNRAVRELTAEAVLTRRQGAGTYVAPQKYQATLLEIKSIADEVRGRGHTHRSSLQRLEEGRANELLAKQFELPSGHPLFHSVIVHYENGVPIQVEDRWVNPQLAPDYLAQDFTRTTPSAYLMAAAPLQGATYSLEALAAPRDIADMLAMDVRQPCLVLRRHTRSGGRVASIVTMWHPGHRYQFAGSVATGAQA